MRVLWIDADENPWTDANGWRVLNEFGLEVRRFSSCEKAKSDLALKSFDFIFIRAEMDAAEDFLAAAKHALQNEPQKIVWASSSWSKEQFRAHAKTPLAANRYAKVPMPPEGFLGVVADMFGCTVEEIKEFSVSQGISSNDMLSPPLPNEKKKKVSAAMADSADLDILRKYLRIKEEQLEITENERSVLSEENERIQKEVYLLQGKLREFEHLHDELAKKVAEMEKEKEEAERASFIEKEDFERKEKLDEERIKFLEGKLSESDEKYENLRVRVRKDIRKIRSNERDLEARLELLRKDSSTLLSARDEKVFELQRKIDALEFDLDQLQDSRVQAQMEAERYLTKLSKVARALQIAVSIVEEERVSDEELNDLEEPLMGGAALAEDLPVQQPQEAKSDVEAQPDASGDPMLSSIAEDGQQEQPVEQILSDELAALANDGEPTQMVDASALESMEGEPESSSG